MKEHLGLKTSMKVYGVGDHGGAATALDIERGIAVNEAPLLPSTKMTGVTDFHEKVKASGVDYPVVQDELNTIFEGCYSSHGDIKWLNRYGETSLLTAETLAALASLDAGLAYPVDALADAWSNTYESVEDKTRRTSPHPIFRRICLCERLILLPSIVPPSASTGCSR